MRVKFFKGVVKRAVDLSRFHVAKPGRRIDWSSRKVIVFESDDWGSCFAFPSLAVYELRRRTLQGNGTEKIWDDLPKTTLEDPDDMERLFRVLERYKGRDGRPARFQANYVMANPSAKVVNGSLAKYQMVSLPEVPEGWAKRDIIEKSKEGVRRGVWHREFHGYAHVNYRRHEADLRNGEGNAYPREFRKEWYCWMKSNQPKFSSVQEYYNELGEWSSNLSYGEQLRDIREGLAIFKSVFGENPRSVVAPFYIWQGKTERALGKMDVRVIQGKNRQYNVLGMRNRADSLDERIADNLWPHAMGNFNRKWRIRYLHRNVDFEPGENPSAWFRAYEEIRAAWRRGEPAIVSTHRINYVDFEKQTVEANLEQLDRLLACIRQNDPEAVYLIDWEVAQLYESGTSLQHSQENEMIFRNYRSSGLAAVEVRLPRGFRVQTIREIPGREAMRSYSVPAPSWLHLQVRPGNYSIQLEKV
jgi:hypothetical protein